MKVTDPGGQTWRVSRRWLPWRPRLRDVNGAAEQGAWLAGDPADIAIWIVVFVVGVVAPVVFSVLFLPLELLALLLVLPAAVLGRVLFARRWHVELRRGWRPWTEVLAGDWRQSGARVRELAEAVRRGELPDRTL